MFLNQSQCSFTGRAIYANEPYNWGIENLCKPLLIHGDHIAQSIINSIDHERVSD
jgi:hypothetical protein